MPSLSRSPDPSLQKGAPLKFLIIRRDNIGDLVCTTPLIRALRQHFPHARIDALTNSYNLPVLENNPDINGLYSYTKAKHRPARVSLLQVYWQRIVLLRRLRRAHIDYVILAAPGFLPRALRLARSVKPRHIIGFTEPHKPNVAAIDVAIPYVLPRPLHEAEDIFRLLAPLDIHDHPPMACIRPDPTAINAARQRLLAQTWSGGDVGLCVPLGIHISARKPSNRWPTSHFITLIRELYQLYHAPFMLFWSPGAADNPLHPGDDAKAQEILAALPEIPILAYPTTHLTQLIAGLSLCHAVICSDGGAMHIAAALAKPIVCFFGDSDAIRWHPWGVAYELLQPPTRNAQDVSVAMALAAYAHLLAKVS